jgi:NAD(P)H-hydrate epimerase
VSTTVARSLDEAATARHGVPSIVLMEHAAAGVAALSALLAAPADRIVVLCGPGNNGGDGYAAARLLRSWGRSPRVLRLAPRAPERGDAATEAAALGAHAVEDAWSDPSRVTAALADADLVVDAVFGTGRARLEGPYPAWIEATNRADALRLAVDVPSGLDADTGAAPGPVVRADVTATMALPKTGLVPPSPGAAHVGVLVEVDIGLPAELHAPYLRDDA